MGVWREALEFVSWLLLCLNHNMHPKRSSIVATKPRGTRGRYFGKAK